MVEELTIDALELIVRYIERRKFRRSVDYEYRGRPALQIRRGRKLYTWTTLQDEPQPLITFPEYPDIPALSLTVRNYWTSGRLERSIILKQLLKDKIAEITAEYLEEQLARRAPPPPPIPEPIMWIRYKAWIYWQSRGGGQTKARGTSEEDYNWYWEFDTWFWCPESFTPQQVDGIAYNALVAALAHMSERDAYGAYDIEDMQIWHNFRWSWGDTGQRQIVPPDHEPNYDMIEWEMSRRRPSGWTPRRGATEFSGVEEELE